MKISDQGFSERLPAQGNTVALGGAGAQPANQRSRAAAPDTLQLSSLAAQLQRAAGGEATHAGRVSAIAAAVKNNTFQMDSGRISRAIVSEAVLSGVNGGAR